MPDVPAKGWFSGKVDFESLIQKLNELGGKGWDPVSNANTNLWEGASRRMMVILKREKS